MALILSQLNSSCSGSKQRELNAKHPWFLVGPTNGSGRSADGHPIENTALLKSWVPCALPIRPTGRCRDGTLSSSTNSPHITRSVIESFFHGDPRCQKCCRLEQLSSFLPSIQKRRLFDLGFLHASSACLCFRLPELMLVLSVSLLWPLRTPAGASKRLATDLPALLSWTTRQHLRL